MDNFKSKPFYMRITGEYALFTDPMTKGGGEKFSYQVPTYQALKGVIEACYWKPTLYFIVDEVKIMKEIRTEPKGILSLLRKGGKDLNYYTYLKDIEYLVKFHFVWNPIRTDLIADRNEKKHEQILLRSMERGGRRDIFLGTRECIGHVERIKEKEYLQAKSYYVGQTVSMGIMFHSFVYPEELQRAEDNPSLMSNFCATIMEEGIIRFKKPNQCEIQHDLGLYSVKKFDRENVASVEQEILAYERMGVMRNEFDVGTSPNV